MSPLFTAEELADMQARYLSTHAEAVPVKVQPKSRAEILVEVYQENPALTVAELSEASSRSPRWVRKVLRTAGIAVPRAPRRMAPAAEATE